jgi:hypothetical protein
VKAARSLIDVLLAADMRASDARVVEFLSRFQLVLPTADGRRFPFLTNDRGEKLLPAFTTDQTFVTWERAQTERFGRGTIPALTVFQIAAEESFDAVVVDPAGPDRIEFARTDIEALARDRPHA